VGRQKGNHGSVLLLIVLVWGGAEACAQTRDSSPSSASAPETRFCATEPADRSLDARGLALVYCTPHPGVTAPLQGAHATARPVFYGAVPAAWVGAGITQDPSAIAAAYRLTLTQGLTYGIVLGVKHAVGRPRPYVHRPLTARAKRHNPPAPGDAHLSFPSGHASLSAALVTSWSLSHPRWYVIGPGALWATGITLSRLQLGVHYPSDVLAGAVLGVGMAVLVDQLRKSITPPPFRTSPATQGLHAPPLVLRVQF
jgi:membrane-associated phospholipid phosphatase